MLIYGVDKMMRRYEIPKCTGAGRKRYCVRLFILVQRENGGSVFRYRHGDFFRRDGKLRVPDAGCAVDGVSDGRGGGVYDDFADGFRAEGTGGLIALDAGGSA